MSREDLHFRLRIPEALKKRIEEAAETNRRSMTAEIVARLEWSFEAGVVEEIGTDISRAMTWADHAEAMGFMVQQAAGTIRELKSEVAAMRFEMHALRQNEGLPDPQESGGPDREEHSDKAKKP